MFIFGIDMPIMEILFVAVALMVISLIFIWIELFRFKKLLALEKLNINELGNLKHSSSRENWIENARRLGYSNSQIREILLKNSWTSEQIDKYLN